MNAPSTLPVPKEIAVRDILKSLVLTLVTCGIYDIYWNARQMETFNGLLGRPEFSFQLWIWGTLFTCGIFHIYYEYKMGLALVEIQKKFGLRVEENLPTLSILLSVLSLTLVVDAIHQHEINKIYGEKR